MVFWWDVETGFYVNNLPYSVQLNKDLTIEFKQKSSFISYFDIKHDN